MTLLRNSILPPSKNLQFDTRPDRLNTHNMISIEVLTNGVDIKERKGRQTVQAYDFSHDENKSDRYNYLVQRRVKENYKQGGEN